MRQKFNVANFLLAPFIYKDDSCVIILGKNVLSSSLRILKWLVRLRIKDFAYHVMISP